MSANDLVVLGCAAFLVYRMGGDENGSDRSTETAPSGAPVSPTDLELEDVWNAVYERRCAKGGGTMSGDMCVYKGKEACENSTPAPGAEHKWDEIGKRCVVVSTALKKECTIDNPTTIPSYIDFDDSMYKCEITEDYCTRRGLTWRGDTRDCTEGILSTLTSAIVGDTGGRAIIKGEQAALDEIAKLPGGKVIGRFVPSFTNAQKTEALIQQHLGVNISRDILGQGVGKVHQIVTDPGQALKDAPSDLLSVAQKAQEVQWKIVTAPIAIGKAIIDLLGGLF